jgi:hypothetical protein
VTDTLRIFGPEHVRTLRARARLAFDYRAADRSADAIASSKLVLADSEPILGPEYPYTLDTRNLLALAYSAARRNEEAIAIFGPLLIDMTRILGAERLDTAEGPPQPCPRLPGRLAHSRNNRDL